MNPFTKLMTWMRPKPRGPINIWGPSGRSLENPSTPLSDPDEWLLETLGGGSSITGIRINRESALTYAAVWRAVNLISRDIAKLPFFVYRRLSGGGKERALTHPAYRLLRRKANARMTAFEMKRLLQMQALILGNGYAWIPRSGNGVPLSLEPIDPTLVEPRVISDRLWYIVRLDNEEVPIPSNDMLHIKGLGFDGIRGYSVIDKAKESLGMGLAAREYSSRFFANNARPSVVVKHPAKISKEAAEMLLKSWNEQHSGLNNSHKAALLEEGMELQEFGVPAKDAQLIESRAFEIREVANWFGVPPHKLGDTTRTAFASLEQENQSYLDDALDGWLNTWEEEVYEKLLTSRQQSAESHVVEFLRQALVRVDMATRFEAYNKALMTGWMTRDEVRERENMNPLPGGEGKKPMAPLNMGVVGDEPTLPPADDEEENPRTKLLADLQRRIFNKIAFAARNASKKPEAFAGWLYNGGAELTWAIEVATPVLRVCTTGGNVAEFIDAIRSQVVKPLREVQCPAVDLRSVVETRLLQLESSYGTT